MNPNPDMPCLLSFLGLLTRKGFEIVENKHDEY